MIIKCTHCGKKMERTRKAENAICFDCKKIKAKERYENRRKTGDVGIPKPDNYKISWEEVRKRLAIIDKLNDIKKRKS